jgi:hypothetical protein
VHEFGFPGPGFHGAALRPLEGARSASRRARGENRPPANRARRSHLRRATTGVRAPHGPQRTDHPRRRAGLDQPVL